ncbi:glycosyltransferase family 2 protein [Hydrotalea sp.]|uniref:glycosyltransferase family 2 protein n=1 Tax=Hydrotalea sp. TaxID=2881279 RepID=UPI003D13712B
MKVSLLIPCYNAANFLPRLIESARAQTMPFHEIICYDDASTDETVAVGEALGVKMIRGERNSGPSVGRNRLIQVATGEWLHFHDADDILHPQFVATMTGNILDNQTQLLCDCGTQTNEGKIGNPLATYQINPQTDAIAYFLQHIGLAVVGLYNRAFLLQHGVYFNEQLRYNEDPDFHLRLALAGARFQSVPETLVYVIGHANSSSARHWWSCISNQIFCLQQYGRELPDKYQSLMATLLADKAYYAIRSGQPRIGYRAIYVLQQQYRFRFRFSQNYLNAAKKILGARIFFRLLFLLSPKKR